MEFCHLEFELSGSNKEVAFLHNNQQVVHVYTYIHTYIPSGTTCFTKCTFYDDQTYST